MRGDGLKYKVKQLSKRKITHCLTFHWLPLACLKPFPQCLCMLVSAINNMESNCTVLPLQKDIVALSPCNKFRLHHIIVNFVLFLLYCI